MRFVVVVVVVVVVVLQILIHSLVPYFQAVYFTLRLRLAVSQFVCL
jgi:hypothetical protein